MSTLLQEYESVNQKINSFNTSIDDFRRQIEEIGMRRNEEIPARIENLKNQLKKIDEYQEKIDAAKQIAEKHITSKNLPTIEAPEGYRVNLNRLKNWVSYIDPLSEDDSYAQRVFMVATCDTVFLQQKKVEFEKRLEELENDYKKGAPDEIKELESKITSSTAELHEYLKGDEFGHFVQEVISQNESYEYKETPRDYQPTEKTGEFWVPGAVAFPLNTDSDGRKIIKSFLGEFYDEKNGEVYIPLQCIPRQDEFAMTVTCVPNRHYLGEMDAGLRNLILRMIDESEESSRRIYVFDAIRFNSSIVGSLKDLEDTFIMPSVPRNVETMTESLEKLVSSFSDIDDVLENYDSVYEYNQSVEAKKRIPRSLVIIVGWPKAFDNTQKKYIERIISNYERYGISFIAVKIETTRKKKADEEDNWGLSDYIGEKLVNISITAKNTNITIGDSKEQHFKWYKFKYILDSGYINTVKSLQTRDNSPQNVYTDHIDINNVPDYKRGNKKLILPYGIDSKGILHSASFENEGFAAYLVGASGSGKSTLLHTLITGIIRNYHPDDVELWLADFKMSEFSQYIDPCPPHVKYILLDESRELVYDLIDRLTEKMMERQRFFMKNRELKDVEHVPPETNMPIIFVILDEFSIMSQAINESQDYRIKLQNLLAKGRALGIKFLFSSQTFTSGIAGLTLTAKAQIQLRIAMKGSRDEIAETLELAPSQKTEQVQGWVDALPPHYALEKYRINDQVFVRRLLVLYFKGTEDNAYQKQKELIEKINGRMHSVDTYTTGNINEYLYKNPVVVDGNSYEKFDKDYVAECIRRKKEEYAKDRLADEIYVAYGNPRLMTNIKLAAITPETRENLLLLAPMSEQSYAAAVLLSIIKSFEIQGKNVDIWAYGRNRMYLSYKDLLAQNANIVEGTEAVSLAIKEAKEKVINRETNEKLVVILGLERITGDFDYIEGDINDGFVRVQNPKAVAMDEEANLKARFAIAWGDIWEKREKELKKEGLSDSELKKIQHDEKFEYYNKEWKEEHDRIKANKSVQEKNRSNEQEQPVQETQAPISGYNAMEDLQFILMQGSRQGTHFLVFLTNYADIKLSKCKVDWFRHRLSFRLAADESRDIFRTKIASELPEHICQYYDTLEGYSFRPYLHYGIDWEGWGIDEFGNIISPFK